MSRNTVVPARSSAIHCHPAVLAVFVQPCRLAMASIQIGAKGDVQPFDTG